MYSDLKVPMDPTVVHLEDIFRIKYAHKKMIEYRTLHRLLSFEHMMNCVRVKSLSLMMRIAGVLEQG
jgi:hypothetical protein